MAGNFPELPASLRSLSPSDGKVKVWWAGWIAMFWQWWQAFRTYLLTGFFTQGDVTILTPGKGVVMYSNTGNTKWRIVVHDDGSVQTEAL